MLKPKLSLKTRILGLMAVGVLGITALYSWRTTLTFRTEHEATGREMATRLSLNLAESSSTAFRKSEEQLKWFVRWHETQSASSDVAQQFFRAAPQTLSVAVIRRSTDGTWKLKWLERATNEKTQGWPNQIETTLVKKMIKDYDSDGMFVASVNHPTGQGSLYTLTVSLASDRDLSGEDLVVGFYTKEFMEELARPFKGALTQVAFADRLGKVVAQSHADKNLREATLGPVLTAIRDQTSLQGAETFKAEDGSTYFSSYQRVPLTNLYSLVSVPVSSLRSAAIYLPYILFILGAAFLTIMSLGVVRLFQDQSEYLSGMLEQLHEMVAGNLEARLPIDESFEEHALAVEVNHLAGRLQEGGSKMAPQTLEAQIPQGPKTVAPDLAKLTMLQKLGEDLARDLRNPLAAVMGNVLLAKGKTLDEEVRKHLEFIEREARHAKDLVERILRFHNLKSVDMGALGLTHLVNAAIEDVELKLGAQGISVHRDFYPVPQIKGHVGLLSQCLPQTLLSLAHLLVKYGQKDLIVRIEPSGSNVRLVLGELTSRLVKESAELTDEASLLKEDSSMAFLLAVVEAHQGHVAYRAKDQGDLTIWIDLPRAEESELETEVDESQRIASDFPNVILEPHRVSLDRSAYSGPLFGELPGLPEELPVDTKEDENFMAIPKIPDLDDLSGFQVDSMPPVNFQAPEKDFYSSKTQSRPLPAAPQEESAGGEVRVRRPRLRI